MLVFYAVRLTPVGNERQRFSLYRLAKPRSGPGTPEGLDERAALELVWPDVVAEDAGKPNPRTKGKLWPFQVRTENRNLPAWHFAITDHGYAHLQVLASALALHHKTDVDIRELHGLRPSNFYGSFKP